MKPQLLGLLLLLSPLLALAQDDARRFSRGDTHLVLPVGVATFAPSTLKSRVRVPPSEFGFRQLRCTCDESRLQHA